jgi:N-6 DNA Methylase
MSLALGVSALQHELAEVAPLAQPLGLSVSEAWNVLVVLRLRELLVHLAEVKGRDPALLQGGRLFRGVPGFEQNRRGAARESLLTKLAPKAPSALDVPWVEQPVEVFGQLYESLLAARPKDGSSSLRKRTGSYYTPRALTELLVGRALTALDAHRGAGGEALRILDPALGAGAFLVQAGRESARRSQRPLHRVVTSDLFGVDVSPLAVAVAEASLWLLADTPMLTLSAAGANLHEADALCPRAAGKSLGRAGIDFRDLAPHGFDLVIGNPPWVAYAGRATQPLPPALREHYRRTFTAFRGYPTLHGLFVELSARLAPRGVVALLIPSPVADLAGYRHVRRALALTHAACEPLLELGQDAFANVTQPCFALVAAPRREPALEPERGFVLDERRRAVEAAASVGTPGSLGRLGTLPRLPPALFGEMGLQTNSAVSKRLLYRGAQPPPDFAYALLEGRNVAEFSLGQARLFLKADRRLLLELRCRLRDASDYARVKLVVRQTAAITIAAAHDGTPFRNSLLAGFELEAYPPGLMLGLLNSTLYRALHLASRRDARQGVFPQVKVQHLRALPAPPPSADRHAIAALADRASQTGLTLELRRELDRLVYAAFGISAAEADELVGFVSRLAPKAGLSAPLG